jgi:hypothetical protein
MNNSSRSCCGDLDKFGSHPNIVQGFREKTVKLQKAVGFQKNFGFKQALSSAFCKKFSIFCGNGA